MTQLAGSGPQELDDAPIRGGQSGGFAADERVMLDELVRWWTHRRAAGDSADPLETAIGGVDARHTVRSVGTTPVEVAFPKPLLLARGYSLWVQALGVPTDVTTGGEVYSLVGLGHFYRDDTLGVLSRYATVGRLPTSATSLEVRTAVSGSPPNEVAAVALVGVAGQTIDWTVEVYRLEI